ncbi:MAG: hypothetical protein EXX96DRAFT_546942 [Benjaminiella poitrasii]|nr:MAG: hypothetical protein EXX96DRAFT_546942 [Benjaminiella poitrasii]
MLWLGISLSKRARWQPLLKLKSPFNCFFCTKLGPKWLLYILSIHPSQRLTRRHAVICLQLHRRLQMPETIENPLSFLLNQLPTKKPVSSHSVSPWHIRWPSICLILDELDQLQYNKLTLPTPLNPGQRLLDWLPPSPTPPV